MLHVKCITQQVLYQLYLCADGLRAVRHVIRILTASYSIKLQMDQQLRIQLGCEPLREDQLEVILHHPQTKAEGYTLQPNEAAVLAYCWKSKFFEQKCQHYICDKLYRCLHPDASAVHSPEADSAVQKLLQVVTQSGWKPGQRYSQALQNCFVSLSSGNVLKLTTMRDWFCVLLSHYLHFSCCCIVFQCCHSIV